MSEELFLRFGRAQFEAARWQSALDSLRTEIMALGVAAADGQAVAAPEPQQQPWTALSDEFIAQSPEVSKSLSIYGLSARVARTLGLKSNGRSHVRRVLIGERRSPRVEAAIIQELKLIESEIKLRDLGVGL